jgi:uncharacterized protein YjiS (DUF1127 family)
MLSEMQSHRKQKTMTLLNSSSGYSGSSYVVEKIRSVSRSLITALNHWIAAFIAHRERQATLALVQHFGDRELKDIGIHRGQIGPALDEAARHRAQRQFPTP